jgi:uncharacterized protein DUF5313
MASQRPNPLQWLRYAYGGRLPDRYREWVLYDATCGTWLLRFTARILAEVLPLLAVAFVLLTTLTPAPVWLALVALGLATLMTLYFTLTSSIELTEVRLVKHGFEPGTGQRERQRRASERRST